MRVHPMTTRRHFLVPALLLALAACNAGEGGGGEPQGAGGPGPTLKPTAGEGDPGTTASGGVQMEPHPGTPANDTTPHRPAGDSAP